MADLAASRPTDVTSDRTGLLPRAGDMLTQFRAVSEQPAFRRALPTIVAVIVTLIGMAAYFLMQQPSRTTLYASLPETEKSRVLDALKNAGVDVVLDPTTGDVMVPASDYHSSRIMLAAQGLPTVVPTGYENLDSIQMGSSRSVESMRLKQAQELELARSVAEIEHVLSARVHLALPEREVFIRQNPSPQPLYLYSWPKAAFWAAHKLKLLSIWCPLLCLNWPKRMCLLLIITAACCRTRPHQMAASMMLNSNIVCGWKKPIVTGLSLC